MVTRRPKHYQNGINNFPYLADGVGSGGSNTSGLLGSSDDTSNQGPSISSPNQVEAPIGPPTVQGYLGDTSLIHANQIAHNVLAGNS